MLHRLAIVLTMCVYALSLRPGPAQRRGVDTSLLRSQVRRSRDFGALSPRRALIRSRRDNISVTKLGMGVLDDIKKIVAGGDPNEVLAAENDEIISKYNVLVNKINALEEKFEQLSDDELKKKTEQFKEEIKKGASLDSLLVEAFAVVSSQRSLLYMYGTQSTQPLTHSYIFFSYHFNRFARRPGVP